MNLIILNFNNRCTVRSTCQQASHSSPRWLSLGSGQQCIDFEQISPDRIPIHQMSKVIIFNSKKQKDKVVFYITILSTYCFTID